MFPVKVSLEVMHGVYIFTNYIHVNIAGSKFNATLLLHTTCNFYRVSTVCYTNLRKLEPLDKLL